MFSSFYPWMIKVKKGTAFSNACVMVKDSALAVSGGNSTMEKILARDSYLKTLYAITDRMSINNYRRWTSADALTGKPAKGNMEGMYLSAGGLGVLMFKELGVVERTMGGKALVRVERSSACESCESRGSCGMEGGKEIRIEVPNILGAKEGERIELSMPTGSLLKASAAVYLVPVGGLLVGAILGEGFSSLLGLGPGASTGAGALTGLILGLGLVVFFDRRVRSRPDYHPAMTRIIGKPPLGSEDACNR
jgi:sigma-E factor negative regulatory protein RseC